MRLVELNPRWYTATGLPGPAGMTFDCPHCRAQRLGVAFHHLGREAIEDAEIHAHIAGMFSIWTISGEHDGSFDGVSLSPSVDASKVGHWHGFITNGEII
jgi:hypothetical protein